MEPSKPRDSIGPTEPAPETVLPPRARRVAYVTSPELTQLSSYLPSNIGRSRQVHDLVHALGLLEDNDCDGDSDNEPQRDGSADEEDGPSPAQLVRATVRSPIKATRKDIGRFHDHDYVDTLLSPLTPLSPTHSPSRSTPSSPSGSDSDSSSESFHSSTPSPSRKRRKTSHRPLRPPPAHPLARYGLLDDSPPFPTLAPYVLALTGAALTCTQALTSSTADVAICWDGGRHHALRERASGFCYVNDAVLICLGLMRNRISLPPGLGEDEGDAPKRTRKARVMYLDFDVHHGDGVALAFLQPLAPGAKDPQILTLSIHHHAPGFFPSHPTAALTPPDTDHPHTLSIPLAHGAGGKTFARVWEEAVESVKAAWEPDYVVVCCGVDGMAGDGEKTGVWNLGVRDLEEAVRKVCGWVNGGESSVKGVVLLGGGGYNHPNAARAFAHFTFMALGRPPISSSMAIPEEGIADEDWVSYGPSFEMDVPAGNMLDTNTPAYLTTVQSTFAALADRVRVAPSLPSASPLPTAPTSLSETPLPLSASLI